MTVGRVLRFAVAAVALLSMPAAANIELEPGKDPSGVADELSYLIETASPLDPARIAKRTDDFVGNTRSGFNLGLVRAPAWVRFTLHNHGNRSGEWVVGLNKSLFDSLVVYRVEPNQSPRIVFDYDDDAMRIEAFRRYRTTAFRANLSAGESATYYLRFTAGNTLLPISVLTPSSHDAVSHQKLYMVSGIAGGISTFIVFATFPMVFAGRLIFLLYAAAQITGFILCAHLDGLTTVYLWPDRPHAYQNFGGDVAMLYYLVVIQFARSFINLREHSQWLDRVLLGTMAVGGLFFVGSALATLNPALTTRITTIPAILVGFIHFFGLPAIAVYATFKWSRNYWPIALAWTIVSLFAFAILMVLAGTVSALPFGREGYAVMIYVEGLCIAVALMLRVKEVRDENLDMAVQLGESFKAQIEENKRAQRLAEERATAILEASEKGRILTTAGHDARQIVSAIRNHAYGLRQSVHGNEDIADQVDLLADDLNDLLTILAESGSTGEIDRAPLAIESVDLPHAFETLRLMYATNAAQQRLDFRLRSNGLHIATDRVVLLRILSNLVSNAIKYTKRGGILVATRRRASGPVIQVWDTGPGMTDDQIAAAVSNYSHRFHADRAEGLGVGLRQAVHLAGRINAELDVRSAPTGTRFELRFPTIEDIADRPAIVLDDEIASVAGQAHHVPSNGTRFDSSHPCFGLPNAVYLVAQDYCRPDEGLRISRMLREKLQDARIVMTTYDRSADARRRFGEICDSILYKPVSADSLKLALSL